MSRWEQNEKAKQLQLPLLHLANPLAHSEHTEWGWRDCEAAPVAYVPTCVSGSLGLSCMGIGGFVQRSKSSGLADGLEDNVTVSTIWGPSLDCFPVLVLRKSVF